MVGGIEVTDVEEELKQAAAGKQSVIFVLENASLEAGKVGKNYELLNCDDHVNFLRRHGKDPAQYRPDICHQVWLVVCSGQRCMDIRGGSPQQLQPITATNTYHLANYATKGLQ
jgi:hypothetical protein